MKENILIKARENQFAIGAFNVNTYDEMVAIADVAQQHRLPVIMMASMSSARFFGIETFAKVVRALDDRYSVPVISHLDHCTKPDLLMECAEAGFDSVMYDGSQLPFEENAAITADLARQCHKLGVFLEGELGVIAGEEGPVKSKYSVFTDPGAALEFVRRTRLDSLAVSIGNAHGFYKGKPEIQFEILREIADKCTLPLVLHGGTGIPGSDIQKAIGMGISKVNVGTEIRSVYIDSLKRYAKEHEKDADVREFVSYLRGGIGAAAGKYMDAFNPSGCMYAG